MKRGIVVSICCVALAWSIVAVTIYSHFELSFLNTFVHKLLLIPVGYSSLLNSPYFISAVLIYSVVFSVSSIILFRRTQLREASLLRKFLPEPAADQAIAQREQLQLGGKTQTVTILFSDIKDFTPLSEKLNPADVTELLNDYFTVMSAIVVKNEGTIDKYFGDGMLVLFGLPVHRYDDSLKAINAGIEMQQAIKTLNEKWSKNKGITIEIRIGIHKGNVVAGFIGSTERMQYTVIGDAVNLAARLQQIAKPNQILVSEDVLAEIKEEVKVECLGPIRVKGKSEPVVVYAIDTF